MSFSILLNRSVLLVAVLLMTACSNKDSVFVAAPQDSEKGSVVYIYRPTSTTNFMYSPRVVIDGNEQFKIGNGDYSYVYLQSGAHTVGLNPTDQYITEPPVSIDVDPGKSYYLRVKTLLKFEPDKMNTRKFWIDVVDEQEALSEIVKTEYDGPKSGQSSAGQADEMDNSEGFSVDKTQDPFAGQY